jgi:hypothetical protein
MSKLEELNKVNKQFVDTSKHLAALEVQIKAPKLHSFYLPEHARGSREDHGMHGIRYSGISDQDRKESEAKYPVVLRKRTELIEQHATLIAEINSMPEYQGVEFSSVLGEVDNTNDGWCCLL